ncbi:uncharacterized protein isoform X6 [Salmo salar]|uniref:Uncharacterized protein isoform X6 n=1 Tax=Salmo salar TaxID=8030 RepID=A0ABM3EYF2_SALSA|nr:uncharacterized protein LOC106594453 isoform X6 [Salmo salar]
MAIHFTERGGGCVISELKMFLFEVGFLVAVLQVYPTYAVENQACTSVEIDCGNLKTRDGRYMYLYDIPGVSEIAGLNMNGTAIANSGGDKPMEFDKNEVVTMNNSSITLYKCQNLTMNFIYSDATQKAGTESNGKQPPVKERCSHYIVTEMRNEVVTTAPLNSTIIKDGDNPDSNRGDTDLIWKIIVGIVAVVVVIAALLCVFKPWRDKQCHQGHRDVEEGQGNPEPNSIPLMQNERRDARDIRKPDDGETVEAVVVPSDQGGEPGEENRQPMDNEETGADTPLLNGDASDQGEEGVLGMEDGKPSDNDRADTETCQKTHAEPPLVNGHHDVRVNNETKEVTPGAQSPGPPQMNGGPPMFNRAAEETTALLDKQALDKDQVTKPPELIDKGHNDMESRRGEL